MGGGSGSRREGGTLVRGCRPLAFVLPGHPARPGRLRTAPSARRLSPTVCGGSPAMSGWSARAVPDQSGRVAVVTGANSGIGYVTARELARRGARVLLACRSEARGAEAGERLVAEVPGAEVEFARLDLGDLASVREFATAYPYDRLDLLVNNAGVMALPYGTTSDGFETQFGT